MRRMIGGPDWSFFNLLNLLIWVWVRERAYHEELVVAVLGGEVKVRFVYQDLAFDFAVGHHVFASNWVFSVLFTIFKFVLIYKPKKTFY